MLSNVIPRKFYDLFTDELCEKNFVDRLHAYCENLKGTAYGSPASSEETNSAPSKVDEFIDQLCKKHEFGYSFEKLDCVTFVETALALAYIHSASNETEFQQKFEEHLKSIRYYDGIDTYICRNHIASLDWCPNNAGVLADVTKSLSQDHETAQAQVDKLSFFYYKTQIAKKYPDANPNIMQEKLQHLATECPSLKFKPITADFPYLPINSVIGNYDNLIEEFPDVSVVQIVRPGWDLTKAIGTQLNVSHQGLVFKEVNQKSNKPDLMFMHATSVDPKQVVVLPLNEYLANYKDSTTIKGINIQQIDPNGMSLQLTAQKQDLKNNTALLQLVSQQDSKKTTATARPSI